MIYKRIALLLLSNTGSPVLIIKATFDLTSVFKHRKVAKQKGDKVLLNRIKIILAEKNLDQKDLVELTGLSRTTISNYCRNTAQPSLETVRMIALALKVNAQTLIMPTPDESEK